MAGGEGVDVERESVLPLLRVRVANVLAVLDAVRGRLHELLGDTERAVRHYRAAAARTTSLPEQHYLVRKAARLRNHPAG